MSTHQLAGLRFGKLVVIEYAGKRHGNHSWLCQCDCGERRAVLQSGLLYNNTGSCGCASTERIAAFRRTHGMANKVPEYGSWMRMRRRCYDPKDNRFANYGGRGITVCDRWRDDFAAFLADMGPRPSPDHSIDRIDNDGPYSPENCRWATRVEQMRNRTNARRLTHDGITLPLAEWAERTGLKRATIETRLKRGWTVERTLTTPARDWGR